MIFNIAYGGVAQISVTAPSGASISATCSGITKTGTGSCTLEVPIIGTWTVTCVYDGVTKNDNVSVTSFGATYSTTFTYTATLTVTTFPGATVAISKTGHSESKTATGGTATFTIPAGQLGTYSISSTYSSWSGTASVNVSAYDASYSATINLSVCDFKFVAGGFTYTFTKDSTTNDYTYCYFYHSGANWEFYAKTSGTLQFTAATVTDVFVCGGGQKGKDSSLNNTCGGGDGGKRRTTTNQTLSGNVSVTVGAAASDSSIGSISSSSGTASAGGGQNGYSTFYAGADGGYCFNDSSAKGPDGNSRKVGAGGGHGAWAETDGGSSNMKTNATNGGSYGGGAGGDSKIDGTSWWANNGSPGTYYGAGGGGAGVYYHDNKPDRRGKGTGGAGYQGLVAMRNKR